MKHVHNFRRLVCPANDAFSLLRRAPLPSRLSAILQIESGVNDPVAVLLTVGLLAA